MNKTELIAAIAEKTNLTKKDSELALAAFTDPALALAFVKALGQPDRFKAELERLETRTKRIRQRQQEAKAHTKNARFGKKK